MKTYNNPTTNVVELDLQQTVMQMLGTSPIGGESITGGNTSGTGDN